MFVSCKDQSKTRNYNAKRKQAITLINVHFRVCLSCFVFVCIFYQCPNVHINVRTDLYILLRVESIQLRVENILLRVEII